MPDKSRDHGRQRIAVIGTGISGLSAAWLLSKSEDVTVFEAEARLGGHAQTIHVEANAASHVRGDRSKVTEIPVDIGFIVYNEHTYPNLTALFAHLSVETKSTDMSLAISLDEGRLEYAGGYLRQLFAQRRNLARPRFWSMLADLVRFYREAPRDMRQQALGDLTLGEYLQAKSYGTAFRDDHLLPMAAAIWSVPPANVLDFPAHAFIRFQENHGLLKLTNRPLWRTVSGGSQTYVRELAKTFSGNVHTSTKVRNIERKQDGVIVHTEDGRSETFDNVVVATHADQALRMLAQPSNDEKQLLDTFRYQTNHGVLHSDASFMPKRRAAWASWNYLGHRRQATPENLVVTYWMNKLQDIAEHTPLFVTLNPARDVDPSKIYLTQTFEHPILNNETTRAQQSLWTLQGRDRVWYCGAYFGAGFHEDGLQAGLAVAEAITGRKRPWKVAEESGRIFVSPTAPTKPAKEFAA